MSFALPEAMRGYVSERVRSGEYGNTSEYLGRPLTRCLASSEASLSTPIGDPALLAEPDNG